MDKARLQELVAACVHEGTVTLASGKTSDFYVDGRLVTLTAEGSALIGEAILEVARELKVTALGGPTTGACPMVSAAGLLGHQAGEAYKLFYVRSAPKGHGMQKAIEGPPIGAEDRVLIVDDVMTSGGSVAKAIERVREETGATVVAAMCIVDRLAGGAECLAEIDVPLRSIFTRTDLKR